MVGIGRDVVGEPLRIRDQGHDRDSGAPPQRRTADFNQRTCDSCSQHSQQTSRWAAITSIVVTSHSQSTYQLMTASTSTHEGCGDSTRFEATDGSGGTTSESNPRIGPTDSLLS